MKPPELPDNIEPRTARFHRIHITMPHYQRLRITLMQLLQQHSQCTLLCLSPSILWCLAIGSQAADIAYTDTVTVVVLAVGTHLLFRTASLNASVRRNHVMVTTAHPTEGTMITVNVRQTEGTARPIGGAVHDNQRNRPHTLQVGDGTTGSTGNDQFKNSHDIEQYALPVGFHTRCL